MQDNNNLSIEFLCTKLKTGNEEIFWRMIDEFGFMNDREYYNQSIERYKDGTVNVIMAVVEGRGVGYVFLNWQPKYVYFKKLGLPEIQDLNVLRVFRNNGIGRQIIEFCESLAKERGYNEMGIGVGMDYSFGAAQRLYARMGYIPDGQGITYDRKQVTKGDIKPVDENLSLMMTKDL